MTAHILTADWHPDTLADMKASRRYYEAMALAADRSREPAAAAMWQGLADDMDERIALHMSSVARAAARVEHERDDEPDETPLPGWAKWAVGAVAIYAAITVGIPLFCLGIVWLAGLVT